MLVEADAVVAKTVHLFPDRQVLLVGAYRDHAAPAERVAGAAPGKLDQKSRAIRPRRVSADLRLRLVEQRTFTGGTVYLCYERLG